MGVRPRSAGGAPGQHFLRSKRLAADLVADAQVARGELIVEIGGGTGVLTQALARAGADVVVIERDPVLVSRLRVRFAARPGIEIVQGDAARFVWPDRAFSVVANLPFASSGAILARLLRDPRIPLRRAHVIVQWQFAAKHAAVWPATLRSIYWRAWYDLSIVRRLDRTAFSPPPGVDGAVLALERRLRPWIPPELHEAYWEFLETGFAARQPIRRALQSSLSPLQVKRLAPALGFSPEARAWEIDAGQWARLFAFARAQKQDRDSA